MEHLEALNAGSIARDIHDIVQQHSHGQVIEITSPDGVKVPALLTKDQQVQILPRDKFDDWRDAPRVRKGTAELETLDSLIDHVNRFKDASSALFAQASATAPVITSVLNYHPDGPDGTPARFGDHRSLYRFPVSEEWAAWTGSDGNPMSMSDFAEFVENRLVDVVQIIEDDELPEDVRAFAKTMSAGIASPAKLLEMSRGLQVNEASVVKQVTNLSTGEAQVVFQSEHADQNGQPLNLPSLFVLAIPVFKLGALYRIAARLRYRKQSGGLVFWYDLWRPDRSFDHAFREACQRTQAETNLPLFYGKPE